MSNIRKSLIQKLATKHNLPLSKIEEIVNYQFKFVSNIIKKGEFEAVRLPYFGKFSVKKGRLQHIQNKKDGITNNK
jgi:nucleoid DNA-binding protein